MTSQGCARSPKPAPEAYKIEKSESILGRVEGDITFTDDGLVSRKHAKLTQTDNGLAVDDLNSANGVYRRLKETHELKHGEVREYTVHPSDFGLPVYDSRVLRVANQTESVQCIQRALANEDGPVRDVVLLNAGAALYCAGVASTIAEGVKRAREAVASGGAQAKLSQFVALTNRFRPA